MKEPEQGKYGLWYVDNVGFATREQAEDHIRIKNEQAAREEAVSQMKASVIALRQKSSYRFLGFSRSELVTSAVIGTIGIVVAISVFLYFNARSAEPEAVRHRASTSEIMECKDRIERRFSGTHNVDVSVLTGTSSDKEGPGGTSRVKIYFELEAPRGVTSEHTGLCQFASGAPGLMVLPR